MYKHFIHVKLIHGYYMYIVCAYGKCSYVCTYGMCIHLYVQVLVSLNVYRGQRLTFGTSSPLLLMF